MLSIVGQEIHYFKCAKSTERLSFLRIWTWHGPHTLTGGEVSANVNKRHLPSNAVCDVGASQRFNHHEPTK